MSTVFRDKSNSNYKFAYHIIDNYIIDNYHTSIHCLYYSCVQLMLHILKIKNLEANVSDLNDSRSDTHNRLINRFSKLLEENQFNDQVDDFESKILALKRFRVNADYRDLKISRDKAQNARMIAQEIRTTLEQFIE